MKKDCKLLLKIFEQPSEHPSSSASSGLHPRSNIILLYPNKIQNSSITRFFTRGSANSEDLRHASTFQENDMAKTTKPVSKVAAKTPPKKTASAAKPAPKAAPKVAPKAVAKTTAKASVKPAPKATAKPAAKAAPKASTKAVPAPTPKVAPKATAKAASTKAASTKAAPTVASKSVASKSVASPSPKPAPKSTSSARPIPQPISPRPIPQQPRPAPGSVSAAEMVNEDGEFSPPEQFAPVPMASRLQRPNTRYSDADLAMFRAHIESERKKAMEEFQMLRENLEDLTNSEMADENASYSMHMAEQGTDAQEKEKLYAHVQRISDYIKKLDEALQRIQDKVYGICKMCGILIAKERLLAVPITTQSASYKLRKRCPEDGVDKIVAVKK